MIQPAFTIGDVTVYHGDCRDVLPMLDRADAVVTDPVYNVGFKPKKRTKPGKANVSYADDNAEYQEWCAGWFADLKRLCAGPIAISCGVVNLGMWCQIEPPTWTTCWWKPASMGRAPMGVNNWEPIVIYGPIKNRGAVDVIRAPIKLDPLANGHPCPKPLGWAKGLVESLSDQGDLVVDCFAGSGTTGVAAMKTGRRCILIEKDERYLPVIKRRLEDAATPLLESCE